MKELKDIVTNLITEAVQSVKTEGRPATATNLSMQAGVGTNVDQLWLRCKRYLIKLNTRLQEVENQIETAITNMTQEFDNYQGSDDVALRRYVMQKENFMNSPIMEEHANLIKFITEGEAALEKYEKEHAANNGITSQQARQELKKAFEDCMLYYDTNLYNKAIAHSKEWFKARGINDANFQDFLDNDR